MLSACISDVQSKSRQFLNDGLHEVSSSLQIKNQLRDEMSPKNETASLGPNITVILFIRKII